MTNPTKPELDDCKHCGGSAQYNEQADGGAIFCTSCFISTRIYGYDRESVLERLLKIWNARAPQWLPISDAPKDGTLIDIWCPSAHVQDGGVRLTDVTWHVEDEIYEKTGWIRVLDDGDYDFVTGVAESTLGLPAWYPTHFMLPPTPPKDGEDV